ncbi:MAG TPA: LysR family transcriptional regulator [Steroidobacteraceae bacterium]|nr:LysR family transcriptional regulator [Steroidobacteraceae bacterium]
MRDKVQVGNVVAMMSFAAVVSTGSFSAAAEQLNCSKAAVSRQIARLESAIGLKLLTRNTRNVALTPAGRELYGRCSRIVDEVNETNQIMAGMLTAPRGDLRINAPVVSTLFRITEIIPQFIKQYPDVRVHVNLSDSKVDLLHGSFDAAFWVGEPYDSALEAVKLREYEMVLAGAPEYFRRKRKPATPADLKEHDCIIETHLSRPGEWQLSKDQTIAVSRGPLTSNSVRLTREAILAGMGIAYLPRFLLAEDLASKRLTAVLPEYVSARLPLYVIFPKGHYVLAKVKAFVDFLALALNEKPTEPRSAARTARAAPAARA